MPALVRGISGESRSRKSPARRVDSAGSNSSSSPKRRSGNRKLLRSISLKSGESNNSKIPIRRALSDKSKGPRRSKSFKKTKGFDKETSFCLRDTIRLSPILSQPAQSFVTYYTPDQVVRGGKFQTGQFFDLLFARYLPCPEGDSNLLDDNSDPFAAEGIDTDSGHKGPSERKEYVVKQVSQKHSKEKQIMQQATLRLVLEAKYLARLNHPNIVQAKGLTTGEEAPLLNEGTSRFYIVMENSVETLEERIERWKRETVDDLDRFDFNSPIVQQKMKYAVALAEALQYLHEKNLVVLNLRPETIGFLKDDTIQIRDLSCCREISMDTCVKDDPLGFMCDLKVKGDAESQMAAAKSNFLVLEAAVEGLPRPRYVAPEAIMDHQFAPAADTYSWAHILLHMLSLSKPYATYKLGTLLTKVCLEGSRPNLSVYGFPQELGYLLQLSWRENCDERPTMKALLEAIPLLMKMSSQVVTTPQA